MASSGSIRSKEKKWKTITSSSTNLLYATNHFYDYTNLFALAFLKISVSSPIWIKIVESNSREHIEIPAEHSREHGYINTEAMELTVEGFGQEPKASPRPRILAVCLARAVF